ncbi:MAG: DUF1302 domain-containing protein [Defluviicoccus sp.]|nr:DUF1302 domain-containing protein [Defluviicoccus sp.]MDE0277997.1 DUF1302 domain-containing protein [Defluviicoccus sp.]
MTESDCAAPLHREELPRPRRAVAPIALAAGAAVLAGLLEAAPARAVEFGNGGYRGSVDTTISQGVTFRVEERDRALAGKTNSNDGNLNYDRGIVANTSKFTTDIDFRTDRFGAFVRTTGFVDHENRDGKRERTELSDDAKERVGSDIGVLDAYVTVPFEVGDAAVDLRLGKHVLNWGESTFIPNGVNAINPFDVSKLRLPGSELREALLPVWMASAEVAATDTLSVAGFYQIAWEETHIDPVGSYFSVTDYVGPGAREAVITEVTQRDDGFGFGPLTNAINADLAALFQRAQPVFDRDFASALRGRDRAPRDSGQWGLALRYLAEDLNQTEFGFYFINYHSRLPMIGGQRASRGALQAAVAAAGAVGAPGSQTVSAVTGGVTRQVAAGLIPQAAAPDVIKEQVGGIAGALAVDRYLKGGHYFLEYPEDIQLFGLSFNTVLGASGWALQGEYSLRPDAPLQRAERAVIAEALEPLTRALRWEPTDRAGLGAYLAGYRPTLVQGYVERNVSQIQATGTKVFGPTVGADALVFVGEAALMHVHEMPDEPLESPAGGTLSEKAADADATSWGYRLAARLDYNNAVGGANLYPYAQFLHDVGGNSPAPSGPFVEGRTAITLGLRADYLSRWQADLSYTRMGGEGNDLADRDFVSLSVKYSF